MITTLHTSLRAFGIGTTLALVAFLFGCNKPSADSSAAGEKSAPYVNSLGMKFVPVAGTKVLFSVWETRVQDYGAFAKEANREWPNPDPRFPLQFQQGPTYPAVNVSWEDAVAFCAWLSKKEGRAYRLPTDEEWSVAVGLGKESGRTPEEKSGKVAGGYPWGIEWPPPRGAGNYADATAEKAKSGGACISGYDDGFAYTSPVGSFVGNAFGLHDLGGNVWEWCEDKYKATMNSAEVRKTHPFLEMDKTSDGTPYRVVRGGSWLDNQEIKLRSSSRNRGETTFRCIFHGFRCVLVVSGG